MKKLILKNKTGISLLMITMFFTCIVQTSFAYNNTENENWILSKSINKVDFFYKITNCKGEKVVLLKFENKNQFDVNVSWSDMFSTQIENKKEVGSKKQLTLSHGINVPTGCADKAYSKSIIKASQISPTYVAEIKSFDFGNASVSLN